MSTPPLHPRDPLHGLTLEAIVNALVEYYGWEQLGREIDIRCFNHDPSVKSSLTFLRRTPWARAKVEELYRWIKIEAGDRAEEEREREEREREAGTCESTGEATGEATDEGAAPLAESGPGIPTGAGQKS